jgi:NAD(P)-dependent dehydrogenase (short-subunit alcohol dehydrogenase family)
MSGHAGVAVVTGAGRGIGAGLARALSARGHHVVVTDVDGETASRTADALDGPSTAMPLDVRDPSAHRAVALAAADLGEVVLWVNNAGVLSTAPVWQSTDAEVTSTIEINTLGLVHGCRAAVDVMRRGDILNVVSLSARGPSSALLFTGPRVLGVDEVVEGAMDLLSSRRQLKVIPAWRGWLTRTQSVLPAASRTLTPMVARVGERRRPVR